VAESIDRMLVAQRVAPYPIVPRSSAKHHTSVCRGSAGGAGRGSLAIIPAHNSTHSSQIAAVRLANNFHTSSCVLPQKEQRSELA
jgi:hypothetical protein